MIMTDILVAIAFLSIGYILGFLMIAKYSPEVVKRIRQRHNKYDGIFKVNTSDPEKDVFTIELECAIGEIPQRDELIFKIENVGSQEKPSL